MKDRLLVGYFLCACTVFILSAASAGCGSKYSDRHTGVTAVEVSGTISLRGSQPYPVLLLVADDGSEYLLRSEALADELKNLKGMNVSLRGTVPENSSVKIPVLTVDSYRLLPLEGGEEPVVGTVGIEENECLLIVDDDTRLTIVGEFSDVLSAFPGATVWVIGERPDEATMRVTGYGIILPAP